jgi:transcriptional regulator with XRE-family HTH domain
VVSLATTEGGTGVKMLMNLKTAFVRANIRQYEAARRLAITDTRLSRVVCGRVEATTKEKEALSKMLNVSVAHLFEDDADNLGRALRNESQRR